jgi:DNA anti-recombination protein RmuC
MSRFGSRCGVVLIGVMCAGWFGTAAAIDPIVLFLLKMIRDSMASSAIQAGVEASLEERKPDPAAALPRLAPLPANEGQWLRTLIDESFVHLSGQQRDELYASLMRMANDPKHAEMRATILAEFTRQAIALRDARRRLAGLTRDQMKTIAAEAGRVFEQLPPEQRKQMLEVLQQGIPGMPSTLNDMMLAEFNNAGGTTR